MSIVTIAKAFIKGSTSFETIEDAVIFAREASVK